MPSTPSPGSIDLAWESGRAPTERSITPSLDETGAEEDRSTLPPPIPLSDYVQAMMQRADEADEAEDDRPSPSRAPISWRNAPTIRMEAVSPAPHELHAKRAQLDTLEDFHDLPDTEPSVAEERDDLEDIERSTIPGQPAPDPFADIKRRLELGDESGALIIAETILASQPDNLEAKRAADLCRERLCATYMKRLGGLSRVPRVAVPSDELRGLALDHRAGFLLSFIDGSMSLEEVLDVASMPLLEALRLLYELFEQGVIDFREPRRRR